MNTLQCWLYNKMPAGREYSLKVFKKSTLASCKRGILKWFVLLSPFINKIWLYFLVTNRHILRIFFREWLNFMIFQQPTDEFCHIFEIFPLVDWWHCWYFLTADRGILIFFPQRLIEEVRDFHLIDWRFSQSYPDRIMNLEIFRHKWLTNLAIFVFIFLSIDLWISCIWSTNFYPDWIKNFANLFQTILSTNLSFF